MSRQDWREDADYWGLTHDEYLSYLNRVRVYHLRLHDFYAARARTAAAQSQRFGRLAIALAIIALIMTAISAFS